MAAHLLILGDRDAFNWVLRNERMAFEDHRTLRFDGADTASDYTLMQARDAVRRTDPFIYAVAIDSGDKRRVSTRVNPDALREITGPSGGYTEVIHSSADLAPATERIANELNRQYTLGYTPNKPPDGNWRSIRVRIKDHEYYARARRGYFALARSPRS